MLLEVSDLSEVYGRGNVVLDFWAEVIHWVKKNLNGE